MITNFQSQNVRSSLIVKQERSVRNVPKSSVYMLPKNNFDSENKFRHCSRVM